MMSNKEIDIIYNFIMGTGESVAPNCICGMDYYVKGAKVSEAEYYKNKESIINKYYGIGRGKIELQEIIKI